MNTNTDILRALVAAQAKTADNKHPNIIDGRVRGSGSELEARGAERVEKSQRSVMRMSCPPFPTTYLRVGSRFAIITAHNAGGARGMPRSELTATDL